MCAAPNRFEGGERGERFRDCKRSEATVGERGSETETRTEVRPNLKRRRGRYSACPPEPQRGGRAERGRNQSRVVQV